MVRTKILFTITLICAVWARQPFPTTPNKLMRKVRGGNLYEQNPNYRHPSPTLGDVDRNGQYQFTTTFGAPINNQQPPPITKLIREYFSSLHEFSPTLSYGTHLALMLFVLWQFAQSQQVLGKTLQHHFVCSRQNIRRRRYHTLITSAFSHASFHHLVVNLYAFLTFGPSVVRVLPIELWMFVIPAAVVGSMTFLVFDSRGMGSCIGLSGVTLALLAFDSLVHPSKELRMIVSFIPIHLPAYYLYLGLLGFSILGVLGLVGGRTNVAHSTHLGGLLFGHCSYEAFRRGWIQKWNYHGRRALKRR